MQQMKDNAENFHLLTSGYIHVTYMNKIEIRAFGWALLYNDISLHLSNLYPTSFWKSVRRKFNMIVQESFANNSCWEQRCFLLLLNSSVSDNTSWHFLIKILAYNLWMWFYFSFPNYDLGQPQRQTDVFWGLSNTGWSRRKTL